MGYAQDVARWLWEMTLCSINHSRRRVLQSLPRWLSETEKEKQDDEDMGMKRSRKKIKHFAEALDLMLEAISGFQRQPLKSENSAKALWTQQLMLRSSAHVLQRKKKKLKKR